MSETKDRPSVGSLSALLGRREFLLLTGGLAITLVLPGCGGGGGGGGNTTPATGDFFKASNVVVKDTVVVLPTDGSVTLSGQTPDSITLSGIVPALVVGSIIVSGQDGGLVRKVTSITPNGSDTIVGTEDAGLTDVFDSAKIQFRQGLRAEHVNEIQTHIDGVVIDGSSSRTRASDAFHISIPKTFIGESNGNVSSGLDISAEGALGLAITGDVDISLANGLEKLELIQATSWIGKYTLDLKGQVAFLRKEIPYATFIFDPIPLGAVGPVPIILLPVLFLQIAASGTFATGFEVIGDGTSVQTVGFRYTQSPPGSSFTLDNVQGIHSESHKGTFDGVNFFGDLTFEGIPLSADLQTSFDGLAGPNFKVDLPAVAVDIKAIPGANTVQIRADAIFRGKLGANAGLLGEAIPQFSITVGEGKVPFFDHTFKPGDGDVEVH